MKKVLRLTERFCDMIAILLKRSLVEVNDMILFFVLQTSILFIGLNVPSLDFFIGSKIDFEGPTDKCSLINCTIAVFPNCYADKRSFVTFSAV